MFTSISFWAAALFGLGWCIWWPLRGAAGKTTLAEELPIVLLLGLAANYLVLLVVGSLAVSLWVAAAGAVVGSAGFLIVLARAGDARRAWLHQLSWRLPVPLLVWAFHAAPVLGTPIDGWDGRSIWFLHSKLIYHHGALDGGVPWLEPALEFAHMDYPKLIAAMGAQAACQAGFWNEYVPKLGLALAMLPCLLAIGGLIRAWSGGLLLLIVPVGLGLLGAEGYMDGLFAATVAAGLLGWGRWAAEERPCQAVAGGCFLAMAGSIKNEGMLVLAAGVALAVVALARHRGWRWAIDGRAGRWRLWVAVACCLAPMVLWAWYRQRWGLKNDLELTSAAALARGFQRLRDPAALALLGREVAAWMGGGAIALALALGVAWWRRRLLPAALWPLAVVATLHAAGVVCVYLVTPRDFAWHIGTSIARTLLTVQVCYLAAAAVVVEWLELPPDSTAG